MIDVGTGSGVLALAAWKLGAPSVTAIDNDPDALQNARDNIARNGARRSIEILEADLVVPGGRPADIVLANLTAAVLSVTPARCRRLVGETGGILIVSGFSRGRARGDRPRVCGLARAASLGEGEWAAAIVLDSA